MGSIITVLVVIYIVGIVVARVVGSRTGPSRRTVLGRRRTMAFGTALMWPVLLYRYVRSSNGASSPAGSDGALGVQPAPSGDVAAGSESFGGLDIPQYGVIEDTDD